MFENLLEYTCEIDNRTQTWKNEYWEPIYNTITINSKCFLDYPKHWLDNLADWWLQFDWLLFLPPSINIQLNDTVKNIIHWKTWEVLDNNIYIVKWIAKLPDDNWINHLEIDLKKVW